MGLNPEIRNNANGINCYCSGGSSEWANGALMPGGSMAVVRRQDDRSVIGIES
jgi:hypothetical protein